MACRCNEVSRCVRDIALLENDVAKKIEAAREQKNTTLSEYPTMSSILFEAIFAQNLEKVDQRFAAIKKQHDGYIDTLQSKGKSELSRVRSRLESYKSEDRRYHEMMAQKAQR